MTSSLKLSLLTLLLALTAACSAPSVREGVTPESSATVSGIGGVAWRNCTFRMAWPEGQDPDWAVDLLLAHQVAGPVIREQGHTLERWRFHRRASRDVVGHQFTFMYYTSATRAAGINRAIEQNPVTQDLLQAGILTLAHCQGPGNLARPGIADSSDPNWSESVQKHWPSYIMGVSQLWLGLIDDAITAQGEPQTDIEGMLSQYRNANRLITDTWQTEGRHAFLHHLNAIFGYEELLIRF